MSKRLVIITQHVDEHAGLMSFFVSWIAELARRFDRIDVITLEQGRYHLPEHVHVHSLGKEHGSLKILRWIYALWLLGRYVPGSTGVFAHMSPIFAIIAWPFAVISRSKLVLWYLHRSVTLKLRLAIALSDVVVTADVDSLQIHHKKIVGIGHGINVKKFSHTHIWNTASPLSILSVGRISPIKNFEILIEAIAHTTASGRPMQVSIVGQPVMEGDVAYQRTLQALVIRHHLQETVSFAGYISNDRMPAVYAQADVVVGLTPPGGIDKVMLEAMAAGCIILTSNTVMKKYFGRWADQLTFDHGDAQQLATRLAWVTERSNEERSAISKTLQDSVAHHHNLQGLSQRLAEIFRP